MLTLITKYVAGQRHPRLAIAETAGIQVQYVEVTLALSVLQILESQAMLDIYFDQLILQFEMISMNKCTLLHQLKLFHLVILVPRMLENIILIQIAPTFLDTESLLHQFQMQT